MLTIILDLVIVCITDARQIKNGKLIKWLYLNVYTVSCWQFVDLVDIVDLRKV